jgi:hypothetical protein
MDGLYTDFHFTTCISLGGNVPLKHKLKEVYVCVCVCVCVCVNCIFVGQVTVQWMSFINKVLYSDLPKQTAFFFCPAEPYQLLRDFSAP